MAVSSRRIRCFSLVISFLLPISAAQDLPLPAVSGKKKVLVTGGAGFVGSHVADHLLQRGDDVVIVDEVNDYYDVTIKEGNLRLLTDKYGNNKVKIYRGDICNVTLMTAVFEKERPTYICHMAARAGVRPSIEDPFVYLHSNVKGTTRLMELSRQYGVQNFVFASSSSVYGGSKSTLFDENELVDHPISPYAASKKINELFSYTWHYLYKLNVTALRFFTVYGPRGRPDMAPFKFIDAVSRGNVLQQFGNGSSSRDYTYIDDIVNGVVRAIDRPYPYQIFNLGKGSGTVLSEFVDMVQKYVQRKAVIDVLPDQPGDVPYTCANVSKAETLLGYKSTVPFEQGIQRTVQWYKEAYPDAGKTNQTAGNKQLRRRRLRVLPEDAALSLDDTTIAATLSTLAPPERRRRLRQLLEERTAAVAHGSWESTAIVEPVKGKKKVLVTGAAGFIGSHVADYLMARGDEVIVVDEVNDYYDVRIKESNLKLLKDKYGDKVKIYRGDICNVTLMTHIFEKERPDWVCHMAARAGVRPSIKDPFVYIHSNIVGTTRLMELSRTYGVKNFVYASSSSVYGGSRSSYFSEDELVDHPISPYAAIYGPRGRPDMAPFKFIDRISRGKEMQQFGDGSSSRDYTYVDDIVDGVVRAVDRPYPYQVFNLGKGSGTVLADFIALVKKYTGNEPVIKVLPDQPGDVPYTCADVRKAEKLLGYKSSVPFEEGIKRTVEWYQHAYPENVKKMTDATTTINAKPAKETAPAISNDKPAEKTASTTTKTLPVEEQKPIQKTNSEKSSDKPTWQNKPADSKSTQERIDSAKVNSKGIDEWVYSFPDWLKNLAVIQWVFVACLIVLRAAMSWHRRGTPPSSPAHASSKSTGHISPVGSLSSVA